MNPPTQPNPITDALRKAKPLRSKQFNMMMTQEEFQNLLRLSATTNMSMAGAVRAALDRMYAMTIDAIPTCASGMPCPFPHVHLKVPDAGTAAPIPAPAPPTPPAA